MIPGFPLDGGRVLRAIVWWITGDPARSTRIAARVGQLIAFGLIIWGIFRFFGGAGFGGLWLTLIGWFLLDAAGASYAQVEISENLRGVKVSEVMADDWPVLDGRMNLQTLVDEHLLRTGQRCFVVEDEGHVSGLITPHEVKTVERAKWPQTTVEEVMRPLRSLLTVVPQTPITEALEVMGREDLNQLPVVQDGHLKGVISRSHILRLLRTRAELQT
jgi:predicted transcriptional regulator